MGFLLVAGDKSGGSQKRFYKQLIASAELRKWGLEELFCELDDRFDAHLARLKKKEGK